MKTSLSNLFLDRKSERETAARYLWFLFCFSEYFLRHFGNLAEIFEKVLNWRPIFKEPISRDVTSSSNPDWIAHHYLIRDDQIESMLVKCLFNQLG